VVGRRRARQGQILFLEGDAGDKTYVVCSGTIDLVLGSAEGDQITLGQVGPGGFLGEMALLDDEPRSATAIVSQTADLLTIARQDLIAHLYGHPETMLNLIRALSRRLRAADDRIRTMRFLDVGGRLAKTLLRLDQPPGRRVPIAIRQEQLANMVGSTRQTVSEILGQWRVEGVVETSRGHVIVANRAALECQTETK
jgi:CRP-like cAMP-binding protein